MTLYSLTHPTATMARGLENIMIYSENTRSTAWSLGARLIATVVSQTVFPAIILLELIFKRGPKALLGIRFSKTPVGDVSLFSRRWDKVRKFARSLVFCFMGVRSPDGIAGFFLKRLPSDQAIAPFGVELQFGKKVDGIYYPETAEQVEELVQKANIENKQISIIGAGMSQGTQTIPKDDKHIVIHTKKLNKIEIDVQNNIATVGSGTTWEQFQIAANAKGKSAKAKQASDPFSIGGSIGINCHGWDHEAGAIASTVVSLDVIMQDGKLRTLTPNDREFGCFFGTLGYFGVVVSAKIKLANNEHLVEKSETLDLEQFHQNYQTKIKGNDIPLFGGRLSLDTLSGDPLRNIEMVRYEHDIEKNKAQQGPVVTPNFAAELKKGYRIERIGLQMLSHFSSWTVRRMLSRFWDGEVRNLKLERKITRNEAMHPPINAFNMLRHSNRKAQWLQEYFISPKNLPNFLRFLGAELKANDVLLLNATIRPVPKDEISVLPYADQERYAVVLCFRQDKSEAEIAKTKQWIENVNQYVITSGDRYYQAYMPYATKEQFEACYGKETVEKMRTLKAEFDPNNRFGNAHTAKYFDKL